MAKTVLIPLEVSASDVRTRLASFISSSDVEQGQLFSKDALSTTAGESEVYEIAQPATATLGEMWMAYTPESVIVETATGTQYKVGDMDPRNFVNVAGIVFTGFKPQVDDKILITADGFTGAIGGNTYAVAADGQDKLVWGGSAISGLSFVLEKTSYITIGQTFGTHRVTAYQLRCVAVA
jgi:hypothetical protein